MTKVKSVIILHNQILPGYIIELLVNSRRESQFKNEQIHLENENHDDWSVFVHSLTANLDHPLLLPLIISGSLLDVPTHLTALSKYINGEVITNSNILFDVSSQLASLDQKEKFLALHEIYVEGLYCFLLNNYVKGGRYEASHSQHLPIIRGIILDKTTKTDIEEMDRKLGMSIHSVRWDAWHIFNGFIRNLSRGDQLLFILNLDSIGNKNNSYWHNLYEKCKVEYGDAIKKFNLSARNKQTRDDSINELKFYKYLYDQSKMLYWWNPSELNANRSDPELRSLMAERLLKIKGRI